MRLARRRGCYPLPVLDKLVQAALRPSMISRVVTDELERLEKGGFLTAADVEKLSAEARKVLEERVEHTKTSVAPVLAHLASGLREALDLPSRAEVLALTEALNAARGQAQAEADAARARSQPPAS